MEIHSLSRRTDLMFAQFSGAVEDMGNYTLIKTEDNPGFHWGNYIIFDRAPGVGDYERWTELFDKSFPYYLEPQHYTFTWDTEKQEKGECSEFLDKGFEFDTGVVLTAGQLKPPPYLNNDIEVRKLQGESDWLKAFELQKLCVDPRFHNEYFEEYKKTQMDQYLEMSNKGMGFWFGAFLGDELVGDLGLFFENGIGRYQNVGTHPEYRKKGICGTLVYSAGQSMIEEFGLQVLVMEADVDYHAARIYESVGFEKNEINYSLSWWRGKA